MGYFLDEDNNWSLDLNEIQRTLDQGIAEGVEPRAIVVINPGNPTGNVLSKKNLEDVIKFAHKNKLFLFADEVYQVCKRYIHIWAYILLFLIPYTNPIAYFGYDFYRTMFMLMGVNFIPSRKWFTKWESHTALWNWHHLCLVLKAIWENVASEEDMRRFVTLTLQ